MLLNIMRQHAIEKFNLTLDEVKNSNVDIKIDVSPRLINVKEYIYWKYVSSFMAKFFRKSGFEATILYDDSDLGRLYYLIIKRLISK